MYTSTVYSSTLHVLNKSKKKQKTGCLLFQGLPYCKYFEYCLYPSKVFYHILFFLCFYQVAYFCVMFLSHGICKQIKVYLQILTCTLTYSTCFCMGMLHRCTALMFALSVGMRMIDETRISITYIFYVRQYATYAVAQAWRGSISNKEVTFAPQKKREGNVPLFE